MFYREPQVYQFIIIVTWLPSLNKGITLPYLSLNHSVVFDRLFWASHLNLNGVTGVKEYLLASRSWSWTYLMISLYRPFSNLMSLAFMTQITTCIWSASGGFSSLWAPWPAAFAFRVLSSSLLKSSPGRSIPNRMRNSSTVLELNVSVNI